MDHPPSTWHEYAYKQTSGKAIEEQRYPPPSTCCRYAIQDTWESTRGSGSTQTQYLVPVRRPPHYPTSHSNKQQKEQESNNPSKQRKETINQWRLMDKPQCNQDNLILRTRSKRVTHHSTVRRPGPVTCSSGIESRLSQWGRGERCLSA